jgi:hypothetical protein
VGEVEEVLDQAQARGADMDAAAIDPAAIDFCGFGQGEDIARRSAETGPDMVVVGADGKGPALADDLDAIIAVGDGDGAAEEAGGDGFAFREIAQGAEHVPLVERSLVRCERHAAAPCSMSLRMLRR